MGDEIECPCCGDVAGVGLVEDGQALLCGCEGHLSCDSESEAYAWADECACQDTAPHDREEDG